MILGFLYIIGAVVVCFGALVCGEDAGGAFLWSLLWPVSMPFALVLFFLFLLAAKREQAEAEAEARRLAALRALQARMIDAGPGSVSRPMIGVPDYD